MLRKHPGQRFITVPQVSSNDDSSSLTCSGGSEVLVLTTGVKEVNTEGNVVSDRTG
jgi:hypothetical protein